MTGSFETQVLNGTKERVLSVLHSELWYFEVILRNMLMIKYDFYNDIFIIFDWNLKNCIKNVKIKN